MVIYAVAGVAARVIGVEIVDGLEKVPEGIVWGRHDGCIYTDKRTGCSLMLLFDVSGVGCKRIKAGG
jgi:hypothetical protein